VKFQMSVQAIDNTALNLVRDLVTSGEHFGPVQALEDLQKWLTRSFTRSFAPTFASSESIFSIHGSQLSPAIPRPINKNRGAGLTLWQLHLTGDLVLTRSEVLPATQRRFVLCDVNGKVISATLS
jgi:hypothetical protein